MEDGIKVCKVTTGSHVIGDIGITVQHDRSVFIPMNLVNRSTDLHRDLSLRVIMRMDPNHTTHQRTSIETPQPSTETSTSLPINLQLENEKLNQENQQLKVLVESVNGSLKSLEQRFEEFMSTAVRAGGVSLPSPQGFSTNPDTNLVQIDVPMFIPDVEVRDVVGSVQTQSGTSDGDSVSEAASRLKALRKKK